MSTTPNALAGELSRERLRGSAVALLVVGGFGFGWAGWGTSTGVPMAVRVPILVLAAIGLVCCILLARRLFRQAGQAAPDTDKDGGRRIQRRFAIIVGVEFVGLFVIARILSATGHPEAICAVVCLGVGVHFLPLAKLFSVPTYVATGLAMCVFAIVGVGAALGTGNDNLWTIIPGLGASLTLFTTAFALRLLPSLR